MNGQEKLHVASPRECNCATQAGVSATPDATTHATPSLRALALKRLGCKTPCNSGATEGKKPGNSDATSPPDSLHGVTLADLERIAGEEWQEVKTDRNQLAAFAHAVSITRMRERGEIPPTYTSVTICKHCGLVPVYEGLPERMESCPWCFNRLGGLPIPRAIMENSPHGKKSA